MRATRFLGSYDLAQPIFRTATLTPLHSKSFRLVSCLIHNLGGPLSELFGAPPFDITMGHVEANLGSWCASQHGNQLVSSHAPQTDHPSHPLILHWKTELSRSFAATRKKAGLFCRSFLKQGEVLVYAELQQTPKDLKVVDLDCNPKGSRNFVRIFVTKGRGVRL